MNRGEIKRLCEVSGLVWIEWRIKNWAVSSVHPVSLLSYQLVFECIPHTFDSGSISLLIAYKHNQFPELVVEVCSIWEILWILDLEVNLNHFIYAWVSIIHRALSLIAVCAWLLRSLCNLMHSLQRFWSLIVGKILQSSHDGPKDIATSGWSASWQCGVQANFCCRYDILSFL